MEPDANHADIPEKLYFSIGEVAEIVNVAPHVLRYWEKEFAQIRPMKRGSGRRLYRRQDVDRLLEIRHLLYERRFTVGGARDYLNSRNPEVDPWDVLREIRVELLALRDMLNR